jgi:hypothetical protein
MCKGLDEICMEALNVKRAILSMPVLIFHLFRHLVAVSVNDLVAFPEAIYRIVAPRIII